MFDFKIKTKFEIYINKPYFHRNSNKLDKRINVAKILFKKMFNMLTSLYVFSDIENKYKLNFNNLKIVVTITKRNLTKLI